MSELLILGLFVIKWKNCTPQFKALSRKNEKKMAKKVFGELYLPLQKMISSWFREKNFRPEKNFCYDGVVPVA